MLFGKEPSDVEVLNDIDGELVNFFQVVKECPEGLLKSFEWELVSRKEFKRLAALEILGNLTEIQRAHRFYYLIMAGWGGELNYPRFQTSITDGGHGNRLIGALETLQARLKPVHERLKTVIIENLDWQDCIDRYDRVGTLMYLDPPYQENGANYLHNMRDSEDHLELKERLDNCKCQWIMSAYDNRETRKLFADYWLTPIKSVSGMANKKNGNSRVANKEILVSNYNPKNSRSGIE